MTENKKAEQLHSKLFSGNETVILDTLQFIREQGAVTILPSLLDLYVTTSSKVVKQEIFSLLIDAKVHGFQQAYIAEIQQAKYKSIFAELLSVCWQSSLSFAEYADFFVASLVNGEFQVAFEAITILESISVDLTAEKRRGIVNVLKDALSNLSAEKRELFYDAIAFLQNE